MQATKIMLWIGFGVSAAISLIIIGFTTYLNVGITFSYLSREELKRIAEEENATFQRTKEGQGVEPTIDDNQDAQTSSGHKEEATGGL